jgi:hypothetical protein
MRASVAVLIAAGVMALACGSSPSPAVPSSAGTTPTNPPARPELTGTWSGNGSDSYSPERVKWVLAQSNSTVTGTAEFAPMDPADGTCASCHKLRKGTFSGTLDGTTLTLRMNFPAGGDVPTPVCVTDLSGSASLAGNQITGTYSGSDTCEGLFANGQLTLTRQP